MGRRALIVTADPKAVAQIQKLITASTRFSDTASVKSLPEALQDMRVLHTYDMLFLSSEFPVDGVAAFLTDALRTRVGAQVGIVIFSAPGQGSKQIAESYADLEVDGFLPEAASVATAEGVIDNALVSAQERHTVRTRSAITAIIADLMVHIDQIALLKSSGLEINTHLERLKKSSAALRDLDDDSLKMYFEVAAETFEKAVNVTVGYNGVSKRVRKMMEEKAMAEVERRYKKIGDGGASARKN
jgi:hypothetical protein